MLTTQDDDDEAPGPLQKIRASICEIAELYAQKYSDVFPQLGNFVSAVWQMLTTIGPQTRDDVVSLGPCLLAALTSACFAGSSLPVRCR